jgi:hypothetical protein
MELSELNETDVTHTKTGLSETNGQLGQLSQLNRLDMGCLFPDRERKFSIHCQSQPLSEVDPDSRTVCTARSCSEGLSVRCTELTAHLFLISTPRSSLA